MISASGFAQGRGGRENGSGAGRSTGRGEGRDGRGEGRGGRGGRGGRTPLCSYFRLGNCGKGDECNFSHVMCRDFTSAGVCGNSNCLFGHNKEWATMYAASVQQFVPPPDTIDCVNDEVISCRSAHLLKIHNLKEQVDRLQNDISSALPNERMKKYEEIKAIQELQTVAGNQLRIFDTAIAKISTSVELLGKAGRCQREIRRLKGGLPFYAFRDEVINTIQFHNISIIIGETGSGKSTQIAPFILDAQHSPQGAEFLNNGKIVVTQPRNIAAAELAKRVAFEWYGKANTAAYSIIGTLTYSKKKMEKMKIVYCTDSRLLNEIRDNPTLEGFSCVVVDEVHERSVNTDLLLGMLKKVLRLRPTLRVILTSATLDRTIFESFFSDSCLQLSNTSNQETNTLIPAAVPVLFVPGRTFPIEDYYEDAEDDYVNAAWRKALSIHRKTPHIEGDILVFLATIVDIDRACRSLQQELGISLSTYQNETVKVLPLHGKLSPEESQRVFSTCADGQRKIIFSTSIAETSVTIDGVVHVIDSGMANVASYDQVRNMTFLDVKLINKSSIKQRRGRAGRTQPGICYHLYSYEEYEELEESIVPEIRKSNLAISLLKLYELCGAEGSKISEFEFVERPEETAIDEAVRSLVEMDLITPTAPNSVSLEMLGSGSNMSLTQTGRYILHLQLPPEIGCMVLYGAKRGVAKDVINLAGILKAGSYVFYRSGSDKDKQQGDALKAAFSLLDVNIQDEANGDWLSMLYVYQEWIRQQKSKQWCRDNFIVWKTFNAACRESLTIAAALLQMGLLAEADFQLIEKEAKLIPLRPAVIQEASGEKDGEDGDEEGDDSIVNSEDLSGSGSSLHTTTASDTTSTDVPIIISAEEERKKKEMLKEAICAGFFMNVCVVNGTTKAGYKVGRLPDRTAIIHPSSTLALVKAEPQCIIYHELVKTSKFFIRGNTIIDQEMLIRISPRFTERIRLKELVQRTFDSFEVSDLGPALISALIGKRGAQLHELESSLLATIDISRSTSAVRVWAPTDRLETVRVEFLSFLAHQKEKLRQETVELTIFKSDTRAILGSGGAVRQLLLKGQYRKVILRGFPSNFAWTQEKSKLDILKRCHLPADAILDMQMLGVSSDGQSSSGYIICALPEYCDTIVHLMDTSIVKNKTIRAQATGGERTSGVLPYMQDTGLKVTWNIYPSNGTANLLFSETGYAEWAAGKLQNFPLILGGVNVQCDYTRNAQSTNEFIRKTICICNIPTNVSEAQLKLALKYRQDIEGLVNATLNRSIPKQQQLSQHDELQLSQDMAIFYSLWTVCGEVLNCTTFPANPKNGRCKAYLRFKDAVSVQRAVECYHEKSIDLFGSGVPCMLEVKADISISFNIPSDMYPKLQALLLAEKDRVLQSISGINISGPVEKGTKGATIKIEADDERLLSIARVGFEDYLSGELLSCKEAGDLNILLQRDGKKFLQNIQMHSDFVYIAWNRNSIRLFGPLDNRNEVKEMIFAYIDERKEDVHRKIQLEPRMFCSFAAAGKLGARTLAQIENDTGVRAIGIDWRSHCFTLSGCKDAVDAATLALQALIHERKREESQDSNIPIGEDICIFCYTNTADYALQTCGHKLCRECLSRVLDMYSVPDSELTFPISCPFGDICQEKIVMQDILMCVSNPTALVALCEQSALQFVSTQRNEYRFCPGINCNQIFPQGNSFVSCSKCCGKFCLSCKDKDGHEGVPWHDSLSCEQYESVRNDDGESLFQQWKHAQTEGKDCQKCRAFVQRNGGCDHMTCICGHNFCYQCSRPSTSPCCGRPCRTV